MSRSKLAETRKKLHSLASSEVGVSSPSTLEPRPPPASHQRHHRRSSSHDLVRGVGVAMLSTHSLQSTSVSSSSSEGVINVQSRPTTLILNSPTLDQHEQEEITPKTIVTGSSFALPSYYGLDDYEFPATARLPATTREDSPLEPKISTTNTPPLNDNESHLDSPAKSNIDTHVIDSLPPASGSPEIIPMGTHELPPRPRSVKKPLGHFEMELSTRIWWSTLGLGPVALATSSFALLSIWEPWFRTHLTITTITIPPGSWTGNASTVEQSSIIRGGDLSIGIWGWCYESQGSSQPTCSKTNPWFSMTEFYQKAGMSAALSEVAFYSRDIHSLILHLIALGFALISCLFVGWHHYKRHLKNDTRIAAGWSQHLLILTSGGISIATWILDKAVIKRIDKNIKEPLSQEDGLIPIIMMCAACSLFLGFCISCLPVFFSFVKRQDSYSRRIGDVKRKSRAILGGNPTNNDPMNSTKRKRQTVVGRILSIYTDRKKLPWEDDSSGDEVEKRATRRRNRKSRRKTMMPWIGLDKRLSRRRRKEEYDGSEDEGHLRGRHNTLRPERMRPKHQSEESDYDSDEVSRVERGPRPNRQRKRRKGDRYDSEASESHSGSIDEHWNRRQRYRHVRNESYGKSRRVERSNKDEERMYETQRDKDTQRGARKGHKVQPSYGDY